MACTAPPRPLSNPHFVPIGNPDLIARRNSSAVPIPPGGHLSDYIPFYFTPFSMMMYNVHTGYGGVHHVPNHDIAILVTSLRMLLEHGVSAVYTDRHAVLRTARFFSSLEDIDQIDWRLLQTRDFRRDNEDPDKTDRYQAEALVHTHLPVDLLSAIACHGDNQRRSVEQQAKRINAPIRIIEKPGWYFQ